MHDTLAHPFATCPDDERGAVYTRGEVVEAILDLIGYRSEAELAQRTFLEPCCGKGDFLIPVITRLVESFWLHGGSARDATRVLQNAITAVEISERSSAWASHRIVETLAGHGIAKPDAERLAFAWLRQDDFLLAPLPSGFDFVAGNPPYVRQERIPVALLAEYRRRFRTLYDRADLYVPFIERSLALLRPGGHLGFICSDRWMKNRYGGPLRGLVSQGFHLQSLLNVNDVPTFTREVIAYPTIFVIENTIRNSPTKVAAPRTLSELRATVNAMVADAPGEPAWFRERRDLVVGSDPWLADSLADVALIRRLEREFPTLEDARCRVGIGVATGADKAFIGSFALLDVEDERKLPLVGTRDIRHGRIHSQGLGVVNPFEADGRIAELDRYPRFQRWVEKNEPLLRRRNVAQRAGRAWYRTIDRIYPELVTTPKLLIPDIKGNANVVYDAGSFYPHHNLYYITSAEWNLHALQGVLRSRVARFVIAAYSLKMQGGFLRFQAQYLRRLRLPRWEEVTPALRGSLAAAALSGNWQAAEIATHELFRLTPQELAILNTVQ